MPVTIAIPSNPGELPPLYARLLIGELLPLVGQSDKLTKALNLRAISGPSSGGNCSVNGAWERPDAWRRVLRCVARFTH